MKIEKARGTSPFCQIRNESRENYLEAIFLLSQKGEEEIRSVGLAQYMGYSKASVSRAVGILQNEGYVYIDCETMLLSLTAKGLNEAQLIYGKHCFFTDLLVTAGVDRVTAEEEACRLEHVISDSSYEKLRLAYGV